VAAVKTAIQATAGSPFNATGDVATPIVSNFFTGPSALPADDVERVSKFNHIALLLSHHASNTISVSAALTAALAQADVGNWVDAVFEFNPTPSAVANKINIYYVDTSSKKITIPAGTETLITLSVSPMSLDNVPYY